MTVSCVLYVRTAQCIFSSAALLSSYTAYHTTAYCLFFSNEINRTQKRAETQFLLLHTYFPAWKKHALIGLIIMMPGAFFLNKIKELKYEKMEFYRRRCFPHCMYSIARSF